MNILGIIKVPYVNSSHAILSRALVNINGIGTFDVDTQGIILITKMLTN